MPKIKGMEEHGLLQIIIQMIWPPLCSFVPLQMVICKEDGSLDDQNQIVFATIVAVLAFFNRLEKEKQRSEFRSEICTVYLV